jgi:hypothetical protein
MGGFDHTIDPNHSFPNEHKLDEHWRATLTEMQKRELERRWVPPQHHRERDFHTWAENHPKDAMDWGVRELSAMRSEREASLSAWVLKMDIQKKEIARRGEPLPFRDPALTQTHSELQMIGQRYSLVPMSEAQSPAIAAEVRRAAADPGRLVMDLVGQLRTIDPSLQGLLGPVTDALQALLGSLGAWSQAITSEAIPDAAKLGKAAEACGAHFRAVQDSTLAFTQTPAMKDTDVFLVKTVVREYVETMAGVVADQLAARAAEPSFLTIFMRLTERPTALQDKTLKEALTAASGSYKSVWADRRDELIDRVKDRAERSALRDTLAAVNSEMESSLKKWVSQFEGLAAHKYDLKTMRDAALRFSLAAEHYRNIIDAQLKQPEVRDGFKNVLDGIQFLICADVRFCVEVLPT